MRKIEGWNQVMKIDTRQTLTHDFSKIVNEADRLPTSFGNNCDYEADRT